MSGGGIDILFESKNYFYLGNYQGTINDINKKSKQIADKGLKNEADYYLYRSYIAQGNYDIVLSEIRNSESSPILQGLRLYASYLSSPSQNKDIALLTAKEWIKDGMVQFNYNLQVIVASLFYQEQDYEEALRLLNNCDYIEGLSLLVQIYLKIDRVDLAEKAYNLMKGIDIDATPSILALAWIQIAQGEEKIKSAYACFEELAEKYGPTPLLLNGQAVAAISMRRFDKAETLLLESIEKDSKNPDTIANLISCFINMKKPVEVIDRYLNLLRTISPKHDWMNAVSEAEDAFQRSKSRYGH
ncbi:hypothetical protein CYY_000797 [Polysphondylium violaceum]|uniref:Coatomer subunit epsilon n=1 Tax=Polysphondylium violaceum TaxID=133409 RepID=A0A8J4Q493_9MYCE|nr:hypothetical protein CYY_000797 [Polysphondylium violaceum]